MRRIIGTAVFVLIGVAVSYFTVSSKDVLRYNDQVVDTVGAVDASFQELRPFMIDYFDGKSVNMVAFKAATQHVGQIIGEKSSLLAQAKVPDKPTCRDFHQHLTAYVANSQRLQELYAGELMAYMEQHNPGTEADVQAVEKLAAELCAKDTQLLDAVVASQQTMATEFNITLK